MVWREGHALRQGLRGSGQHPSTLELENGQHWVNYLASVKKWRLHQQGGYPNTAVDEINMDAPRVETMTGGLNIEEVNMGNEWGFSELNRSGHKTNKHGKALSGTNF